MVSARLFFDLVEGNIQKAPQYLLKLTQFESLSDDESKVLTQGMLAMVRNYLKPQEDETLQEAVKKIQEIERSLLSLEGNDSYGAFVEEVKDRLTNAYAVQFHRALRADPDMTLDELNKHAHEGSLVSDRNEVRTAIHMMSQFRKELKQSEVTREQRIRMDTALDKVGEYLRNLGPLLETNAPKMMQLRTEILDEQRALLLASLDFIVEDKKALTKDPNGTTKKYDGLLQKLQQISRQLGSVGGAEVDQLKAALEIEKTVMTHMSKEEVSPQDYLVWIENKLAILEQPLVSEEVKQKVADQIYSSLEKLGTGALPFLINHQRLSRYIETSKDAKLILLAQLVRVKRGIDDARADIGPKISSTFDAEKFLEPHKGDTEWQPIRNLSQLMKKLDVVYGAPERELSSEERMSLSKQKSTMLKLEHDFKESLEKFSTSEKGVREFLKSDDYRQLQLGIEELKKMHQKTPLFDLSAIDTFQTRQLRAIEINHPEMAQEETAWQGVVKHFI